MQSTSMIRRTDRHDTAAYLITLPYLAIAKAAAMASSVLAKTKTSQQKPPVEVPASKNVATSPAQPTLAPHKFSVADRVHSVMIDSDKVCFFLYAKDELIKVTTRKGGFTKEAFFTPAIAASMSATFTISSAVLWIKRKGFDTDRMPIAKKQPEAAPAQLKADPKPTQKITPAPIVQTNDVVHKSAGAKHPFIGRIVSFGETVRPGRDGGKPYQTYYMLLSNNTIGEREFIGEQLAELVASHNLSAGQLVRLHPLGKRHFTVNVDGKEQQRTRNEYAVDVDDKV